MINLVFPFFLLQPLCPCPCAVGQYQQQQRNKEPQHGIERLSAHVLGLQLAYAAPFQGRAELLLARQVVMAPLANDGSALEQQQSGVAPDDGLERCHVHGVERIFGSCQRPPPLYGIVGACRETEEVVAMLGGIFVYAVYIAEVAVVGMRQVGRNEQKGIARSVEHLAGDVVFAVHDGEVVYRWHVACIGEHRLTVYESPCRVGIVVQSELLLHAVLLQYKRCFVLRLLSSFGYLHAFLNVGPYVIRPEIERRNGVKAIGRCGQDVQYGEVDGYPLVGARYESHHAEWR